MTKSDWDYRGLAAECYDLWFGNEPFWDQAFFHNRIRHNGGEALEIACGTGRLLVPFLRDGLAVEGLDASAEMLAICRSKAARVGVTPTLHQQLMQDVDLPARYRTVFIPTCSFQILAERDEAFEALRRFYRHLEPGGELLITLAVPWRGLPEIANRDRIRTGQFRHLLDRSLDVRPLCDPMSRIRVASCGGRSTQRLRHGPLGPPDSPPQ